jgi:heavy metal sensor kinase
VNTASLRFRLSLWHFVSLAIILVLFWIGVRLAVRASIYRSVDNDLASRLDGVHGFLNWQIGRGRSIDEEEFEEHSIMGLGGGPFQVCDGSGNILYSSRSLRTYRLKIELPSDLHGATRFKTEEVGGDPVRIVTQPVNVKGQLFTIQIIKPLHDSEESLEHFQTIMLWFAPVLLLIASASGYWIISRALDPVDRITSQARFISIANLSSRLAVPPSRDELQRLSMTLNEMLDRIEKSVCQITQFTTDASHELRAPLTLIHMAAEFSLRRERGHEELVEAMRKILREEERMTALVNDLLLLARGDSGIHDLRGDDIDLGQLLRDAHERAQILAKPKAVAMGLNIPLDAVTVNGNEQALHRLLLILLDNAIKYTPTAGRVILSLEVREYHAWLKVEDNGIGIAAPDLTRIFDRFWRADKARSRSMGGAGLGLSIALWIVKSHAGEITVESESSKGSTFTVRLPLALEG